MDILREYFEMCVQEIFLDGVTSSVPLEQYASRGWKTRVRVRLRYLVGLNWRELAETTGPWIVGAE